MSSGPAFPALLAHGWACVVLVTTLTTARAGASDPALVLVLPTSVRAAEDSKAHPRSSAETAKLEEEARRLDAVLGEAVQDLGLTLDVSELPRRGRAAPSESQLVARAARHWVVAPSLESERGGLKVRLVTVAPSSKVMHVRVETVPQDELDVEAMRMLRELVSSAEPDAAEQEAAPASPVPGVPVTRSRSPGRAVLALNAAILGGYAGYALQRASGSEDDRLVYPLTALGAGVGLGASVIIADEWDIGVGDAWYLAAGSLWGGAAGLLLTEGYDADASDARPLYGVLGSVTGVTLATTALSFTHVSEGGAALAHSGGAVGLLLGGIGEAMLEGATDDVPTRGAGWGAASGVLVAGALATQIRPSASRVLLLDLAAGLGALTGAAAASPLVFGDAVTETENRLWLGSIALGTVLGAGVGALLTRAESPLSSDGSFVATPFCGPVAGSVAAGGPALGLGVSGTF